MADIQCWEEVGRVTQLNVYALKSGEPQRVTQAQVTPLGLAAGGLQDRSFMVVKEGGPMLTGRQNPRLTNVQVSRDGPVVTFSFWDTRVEVDLAQVEKENNVVENNVFGSPVRGLDCGDAVAEWMTREVYTGRTRVRVLYHGGVCDRPVKTPDVHKFNMVKDTDKLLYADVAGYLVVNEASVADLNTRLSAPITADRFKPNIVVSGSVPYDEDDWAFLKIGSAVLRRLMPADRCIFTTVDPKTCTKDPNMEPLATLRRYRLLQEPRGLAEALGKSPIFGSQVTSHQCGDVTVGDAVMVARTSQNPQWKW